MYPRGQESRRTILEFCPLEGVADYITPKGNVILEAVPQNHLFFKIDDSRIVFSSFSSTSWKMSWNASILFWEFFNMSINEIKLEN